MIRRICGPARRRLAVTLVEFMMASLILVVLAGAVLGWLHRLGFSLSRAEEDLTGGREVQRLLKWFSLRIGSLNPPLAVDRARELWQLGEERGGKPLHRIWVLDTDGRPSNGGEALEYLVTSAEPYPRQAVARLSCVKGRLIESREGREEVVGHRVTDAHFRIAPSDPRLLFADLEIELLATSRSPGGGTVRTRVAVRPEADRVVFALRGGEF